MDNKELLTRGVEEIMPKEGLLEKLKKNEKLRVYLGIDPTGNKLHLGHSIPLRKLRAFQEAGHHVIFLIGSFTAMIGDPTGKDELRKALTRDEIEKNFHTYKEQAAKILDFDKLELRYNHEWLEKLNFQQVIELSSNFTVQQMLQRDMYKKRLKEDGFVLKKRLESLLSIGIIFFLLV